MDFKKLLESVNGIKISYISLINDVLKIVFEEQSNKSVEISDEGQTCCETRYITCDDDFSLYAGSKLLNIEVLKEGKTNQKKNRTDVDDEHEVRFVRISTSDGSFTLCTHNEHNGYYGGFDLQVRYCEMVEIKE